MVNNNRFV